MFAQPQSSGPSVLDDENLRRARTMHVGNLNREITPAALALIFKECGSILAVRVSKNSQGGVFGFVEFGTVDEADNSRSLNGVQFGGMPVTVSASSNIITDNQLPGGQPIPQGKEGDTALTTTLRAEAQQRLNPHQPILLTMDTCCVHIRGLGSDITASVLKALFSNVGVVEDCRIAGRDDVPTRFGFVTFSTNEAAARSVRELSGTRLGEHTITVSPSTQRAAKSIDGVKDADSTIVMLSVGHDIRDEDIKAYLETAGGVLEVEYTPAAQNAPHYRPGDQKATILMVSPEAAKRGVALNGRMLGAARRRVAISLLKDSKTNNARPASNRSKRDILAALDAKRAGSGGRPGRDRGRERAPAPPRREEHRDHYRREPYGHHMAPHRHPGHSGHYGGGRPHHHQHHHHHHHGHQHHHASPPPPPPAANGAPSDPKSASSSSPAPVEGSHGSRPEAEAVGSHRRVDPSAPGGAPDRKRMPPASSYEYNYRGGAPPPPRNYYGGGGGYRGGPPGGYYGGDHHNSHHNAPSQHRYGPPPPRSGYENRRRDPSPRGYSRRRSPSPSSRSGDAPPPPQQ